MTTPLSVHRSNSWRTELNKVLLGKRPEGSGRLSGQQQASVPIVQNKDERAVFDEVFLPHMAEAYRLAQWLTGNAYDADDVVQDAALRAFRGIRSFGAVNARAWSLAIVRNTAYSWLVKNRPKAVFFTDDLSAAEQQELEHEGPHGTRIETPEEIALFKAEAEDVEHALAKLPAQFREVIVLREINQLNYRDIAEIINVPIGTVMSRLSRGRQLLVALLADRE
ncbi:RNA polymerase sigma-70 factor, ECF subfamily [Bradyrhizobium erythrophlei]|nr:RNA polymerase sigma-70 factor, ECF subfamily [Bradyrhizobium erythrophlei]